MKRSTLELSVGVFILIGIICVGYLTIKLGQMEILGSDTYTLKAHFLSVAGLKSGAAVEMAGVQVGQVESIDLDLESREAVVQLKINNDLKLSDDVIASVKTAGLIGDKYISLSPGGSDIILNPGERILETESAVDLEALISKYVFGGV
jgi:phospholipid/cholesterol/gamma-HCH transport system substrate-binding protein